VRTGDLVDTGQAYNTIAMVATRERRHEDALEWYLKVVARYEADGADNPPRHRLDVLATRIVLSGSDRPPACGGCP
jgi:hypothetical protein